MKNVHLTFERAVEAATGEKQLNVQEKEHAENCSLCQGRIKAAQSTDKALMDSKKLVPFVDSSRILDMADKVFEQETAKQTVSAYKLLAVAASLVLIVATVAFFTGKESSKIEKPVIKTAKVKEEQKQETVEEKVNRFPVGVMKIAKGSVLKGERCELEALSESEITVESESYFIVEKGRVKFSVTKGEDFMVKLNGNALVRVLGTVFTVEVKGKNSSVQVSEGLVELIDLDRGVSKHLAKGQSGTVNPVVRKMVKKVPVKKAVTVNEPEIVKEERPTEKIVVNYKPGKQFKLSSGPEMRKAEINDLEFSLKFSDNPANELNQLFVLYAEEKRFGSILNYWRSEKSAIRSEKNPNLKRMHYHACKASIELNVYNKVCAEYKETYQDGPFPSGMDYHLKMTQ